MQAVARCYEGSRHHLPKIQIPKKACPCKLEGPAKSITACRQHSFWLVRLLILRSLRAILCPNAKGYSSGAGMCADWRHHHAWNANPQKRPTRGLAASLFLAERYGLLVGKGFAGAVPAEVRSVTAHRRHCCDCTNVPCGAAPRTRGSLMAVPNFTQR